MKQTECTPTDEYRSNMPVTARGLPVVAHDEPAVAARGSQAAAALRMLTVLFAFFLALLGGTQSAEAKSPMCGDAGESIAAPPPLVASADSTIAACHAAGDLIESAATLGDASPRLSSPESAPQLLAIVPPPLIVPSGSGTRERPLSDSDRIRLAEHRWASTRPPCVA